MPKPKLLILGEQHIGDKVRRVIRNAPDVSFESVPDAIHPDDDLTIDYANRKNQMIVTRDSGIPGRKLGRALPKSPFAQDLGCLHKKSEALTRSRSVVSIMDGLYTGGM